MQPNWLQQFTARVAAQLADADLTAYMVQMPGNAGRGSLYRCQVGIQEFDKMVEQWRLALQALSTSGHQRIGIISASLGAVGLLHALAGISIPLACALINPVYDPTVVGWPHQKRICPSAWDTGDCHVLVLYCNHDEVAPYAHSVDFIQGARAQHRTLFTLEGEGHIFRQGASRDRASFETQAFFSRRLREQAVREL
jgi:predicted alpha/beta hydrolase family esterase